MTRRAAHSLLLTATVAALTGCGLKGDPLPPLIRRADATRDLAVYQEGLEAVLSWSYPSLTTAGEPLPDLEAIEVWTTTLPAGQEPPDLPGRDREMRYQLLAAQGEVLAALDPSALADATRGPLLTFRDDLARWHRRYGSEQRWVVWYAVRTICCRGRASEFSNLGRLVPQLPPAPPTGLSCRPSAAGITLIWQPAEGVGVIVERSADDQEWRVVQGEPVAGSSWQDASAEQGRTWSYRVRATRTLPDGGRVVGEAGPPLTVAHPDRYPPAPPADLVCLPEEAVVRIRWQGDATAAWYVVLRRVDNGEWVQLGDRQRERQLDDPVPPQGALSYAVRVLDEAGNISEPTTCTTRVGALP